LVTALAAALAATALAAVQPPVERPAAVTVDFAVVQADGMPVDDLQPPEVEVRIGDRIRIVRSLRRISTAPAPIVSGAGGRVAPPYGTNENVVTGRSFALVVDQESFTAGKESLLRNAIDGLLTAFTAADQATIVALPFGGQIVAFTSDTARIRLALNGLAGQGRRAETGSELACRTRRFLESLDEFLRPHAGRRSPLTVVLFTAGLAGPRRDAPMALAPGMCELLVEDFRRTAATASAARANFYVVPPADVGMSGASWRSSVSGVGDLGSDNPLEGIEHLTGVTGGARVPLDATGTGSLLRVARETSAFYVAELEPERGDDARRSRSFAVRVTRRGVTVRARPAVAFSERPARNAAARLAVSDVLLSREAFMDLRLRAAGVTMRDSGGRVRVGVVIEPVDSVAPLASAGAVLFESDGRIVARWSAKDAAERPLLGAMAVAPGTYRLRVAAVDAAGHAGAAEDVVEAALTSAGPLSLGSLVLGVSRHDGTEPRLEFGSEPTAIASFDTYGGDAGMKLSATLELARDADGPPLVTVPLALKRADDSRVVATGAAPIGALPPGDYVVRGVIQLEDGTRGRVIRTLRKVVPR
jgi:hypothetical protein